MGPIEIPSDKNQISHLFLF